MDTHETRAMMTRIFCQTAPHACREAETIIPDDARLEEDLGMDDVDRIEAMMRAEEAIGVDVDDDRFLSARTFGEAVEAVLPAASRIGFKIF